MYNFEDKYEYNKFPQETREQVVLIQTIDSIMAVGDCISGIVFPDKLTPQSLQSTSFQKVSDYIRYSTGKTLLKIVDISELGYRFANVFGGTVQSDLTNFSRNDAKKMIYINPRFICRVYPYSLVIPSDIVNAQNEYRELAAKGNNDKNGLVDNDLKRYNDLKKLLTDYYSKAID